LVVGAGPSGLLAACELARYGIRSRIVDRQLTPHQQTRATAIQPAGLELLARAGVLAPFLEQAAHVRRMRFFGPGLTEIGISSFVGIGWAYEYQCSLPQWQTERILLEHLHLLGGSVERGTTVLSVTDETDEVRVQLRRPDGDIETTAVRYLLGGGGAHSITRHSMHESLGGETYAGRYIVADVRANVSHEPDESMLFVSPEGPAILAPLPQDRWISFANLDEDTPAIDLAEPPELAQLSALLNHRVGVNIHLHDLRWAAQFNMHNRMARRLAEGRCFLMGDAAHLSSPIGGEGLNSALMDAADIAWKLGLVLCGRGLPALLDSYAIERSLADRRVLQVSDTLHRRVMDLVSACARDGIQPTPPPDPVHALEQARARAMLDVSYAGSALIGEHIGPGVPAPDGPAPGMRFPDRIRLTGPSHHLLIFGGTTAPDRLRRRWESLVSIKNGIAESFDAAHAGVREGGAVLVRPDGFIGFRTLTADAAGFEALDAHLASYLVPDKD
jgi:2-polyprenyl-6-methoxyphenol hydroxylase-like FAD-dependent oxidoreductase